MISKVVKNIVFQNKTLLVMFYRHNKTFWYQFCNFKHFLKAENSEDSLASSCVEFYIGLSCNPVWDWVTIGTIFAHTLITYVYSHYCIWSFCHHFPCKNDVLIASTWIEFSNHENIVPYTNFLSIASCRIVNVRYRNDSYRNEPST